MTPFVYSSTFLYLTDYIRENTNLDDEQIKKEIDLLGENNSSDTVRSLYEKWFSLRFKSLMFLYLDLKKKVLISAGTNFLSTVI